MTNREIDALVDVHVFGKEPARFAPSIYDHPMASASHTFHSGNIAEAWRVAERMEAHGFLVCVNRNTNPICLGGGKWHANFFREDMHKDNDATADTAPMAIALAALKALGVEV